MKSNVTMKDIADQLGVSSVTVSKALNDKEGV
ncbi:LacI family DNA-binding transcriptional regulator, partial [Caldalkalibacillus horti]